MCTLVILRRPRHAWPVLVAANRDEMVSRPWQPPARHWPDRLEVVAGLDELAGGSWLGINDHGVVAGILNRVNSLGPAPGLRSRGELPLEALDHAEAAEAAEALSHIDPESYRSFNLVVADSRQAFLICSRRGEPGAGTGAGIEVVELPAGLSMITARDRNDPSSPRLRLYLPRFAAAEPPDPETGDWSAWQSLLASRIHDTEAGPAGAMNVVTESGFGTVAASLIALPAAQGKGERPIWLFAAGRPGEAPFTPVAL